MTNPVKNNGVVFTPKYIAEFMVNFIKDDKNLKIFEPSCGEGIFLETLIEKGYKNLYANDVEKTFINKCKASFKSVTYFNENFIDLHTTSYDIIIGNPPYVKIQNLEIKDVIKIKNEYDIVGNIDLYIYFILKCVDMLTDNGKLIFIVPNSFMYNKSCEKVKQKIIDLGYLEYVIDFRDKKIFPGYSVYTCIIVINKKGCTKRLEYLYKNSIDGEYKPVPYKQIVINNSLLKYINVKNGIATLSDHVFILKDVKEDDKYVYFVKNNIEYKVEKEISRKILKVSKQEEYRIIYPYDAMCKIYDSLDNFPYCSEYLDTYKEVLLSRDKGNKKYEKWFAFGRTQALHIVNGSRMFIPSLVKNVSTSIFERDIELFYSGLYIQVKPEFSHRITNIDIKKVILENSSLIESKCNVKSDGWFSITKKCFDIETQLPFNG